MVYFASTLLTSILGLAAIATCHPGHNVKAEAAERAAFLQHVSIHSRSLSHCAEKLKARGIEDLNVARREVTAEQLRYSDGLFAWISVGIDPETDSEVTPAAYYTEQGGMENENSGMGMGPSGTSSVSEATSSATPSPSV